MNIYSKQTYSKKFVSFNSNHPKSFLKNVHPFLDQQIPTIVQNGRIRTFKFSDLKPVVRNQKYPSKITDAGIEKVREIPAEVSRNQKNTSETPILLFVFTFNPNNNNIFLTIKNTFKNLQKSKMMKYILKDYILVKSWMQPPNLERKCCKSKFSSEQKTFKVKISN